MHLRGEGRRRGWRRGWRREGEGEWEGEWESGGEGEGGEERRIFTCVSTGVSPHTHRKYHTRLNLPSSFFLPLIGFIFDSYLGGWGCHPFNRFPSLILFAPFLLPLLLPQGVRLIQFVQPQIQKCLFGLFLNRFMEEKPGWGVWCVLNVRNCEMGFRKRERRNAVQNTLFATVHVQCIHSTHTVHTQYTRTVLNTIQHPCTLWNIV